MQTEMSSAIRDSPIRESVKPRDAATKEAAYAAGAAAAHPLLAGEAVRLACPRYEDGYLAYLWYQGFGQAIINRGRTIGDVDFGSATGTPPTEGAPPASAAKTTKKAKGKVEAAPRRAAW